VTLAALPILWTPNVVVAGKVVGGFRVAIPGALLFAADGWIATGYVFVWQIALTRCRRAAAGHRERPLGPDVVVETRIVKSKGDVTRLDYLLRQDQGGRRISDVYLDGSISQLAVHRSEFHSILRREGVDGLVMALNRKVDLLRNVAKAS
jgi:hypothetical protein